MTRPIGSTARRISAALLLIVVSTATGCRRSPDVAKQEYLASGDAYVAQNRLPEAIIQYRNAIQQDPRFGLARRKLGDLYLRTGDRANALQEYIRAADLLADDADVQVTAGGLLLVARRFEDAQARAEQALRVAPTRVDAQILRANALAGLNQLDAAVADLEKAIDADPSRASAYASLGAMQFVRGNPAAAEAAFRKAVEAAPTSASAHLALANFYLATRRGREAEVEMKAALALDARSLVANRALAYYYIGSGRPALAEPHLRAVAELTPDASGKLALAAYYISRRQLPEARRVLDAIVSAGKDGVSAARLQIANLAFAAGVLCRGSADLVSVVGVEPAKKNATANGTETNLNIATITGLDEEV
jgi:tetratricopeptide (TPR) repeat protein